MRLRVDPAAPVPLYRQIVEGIIGEVRGGRIPPGGRLPSCRALAKELAVNPLTVAAAYRELQRSGWLRTAVGRGSYVSDPVPAGEGPRRRGGASGLARPRAGGPPDGAISFAPALPAAEALPAEALRRAFDRAFREGGGQALQYPLAEGYPPLRTAVARHLGAAGIAASPEAVLITSGAAQGLMLVARALVAPGDVVLTETPTSQLALGIFGAMGTRVVGVSREPGGIRPEALELLAARLRPRLLFVIPTFHNPTGLSMSLPRRRAALEVARRHGVIVLEEDHLSELYYGHRPPTALAASAPIDPPVLYLKSFSKIVAPGLRVGALVGPAPLLERVLAAKHAADPFVSGLAQQALAFFLGGTEFARHLAALRSLYRRRRDALLSALAREFPREARWTEPEGGLSLWVTLPEGCVVTELQREAWRVGVDFLPGTVFSADGGGGNALRLSFGHLDEAALADGIRRLGTALRRTVAARPVRPLARALTSGYP